MTCKISLDIEIYIIIRIIKANYEFVPIFKAKN